MDERERVNERERVDEQAGLCPRFYRPRTKRPTVTGPRFDRPALLGSLLVVAGSLLPSIMRPPWESPRLTEWIGPAGRVGLFFYDYLVLATLLVTLAAFLYADTETGDRLALLVGGLLVLATRGWFVWERFLHDHLHSGFTLGWGVYVSVVGALLLVAAGFRGLRSETGPDVSRPT